VRPLLGMPALEIRDWLAAQGLNARHPARTSAKAGWRTQPIQTRSSPATAFATT
jgi:hypothetical protein